MSYADRAALDARFGAGEIDDVLVDISKNSDDHAGIVRSALDDASAEIDGALAVTYVLPLPTTATWPQLVSIACDLARARLYDEAPPDNVIRRQRSARTRLRQLSDGRTRLVDDAGKAANRIGAVAVSGAADTAFSEKLEDYC